MEITTIIWHILNTILLIGGVLYSIILHEMGHAWVAYLNGDSTAKRMGRLTLNPVSHVDIFGTLILPVVMLFTTGSAFGWAKPVPVNPANFRHHRSELWVSLAGVALNLLIALVTFSVFAWSMKIPSWGGGIREYMMSSQQLLFSIYKVAVFPSPMVFLHVATLNLMLMIFNLLPFPPLDGFHALTNLLPQGPSVWLRKNQTTFLVIFLVLLLSGLLSYIYTPIFNGVLRLFLKIFGV